LQRGPSRFRRAVFGAIAGVTAFGTLSGLAVQAASAAPTGNNLAGADRYQTAGNLNAAKFGAAGIGTVLLADAIPGTPGSGAGGHQSDALAVSGYAGLNHDGLLLTDTTNTVPANTMSALSTLKVKNVIAVGGSAAISSAQVAQLTAAGYTVTQPFAGADRYATMQMIDNSFTPSTVGKDPSGNNTAILASGDYAHLVDALAAGGLAYAKKFPVILTPTGSTTLGSQASSEISSLQIKHLIVVGGTASIPSSQYTPNPSGVTTVDVLSGADRSATSEAIEKAAVGTYGFGTTKLGIAAGATFVGSTSQVQNDGADALSSAPYLGDPEPMCVTNGPTDVGSAPKCVSDVNPTTVDWLTGTANLPASQQSTILAGGTSTSPNSFTVSGGSAGAKASTSTAPSQGATTYTVSGLPTAAGTVANIALFPCTGTAQSGNNTTNGAPTTSSGGSTTFTAPGGTTPVGGNAVGQGTTSTNTAPATAGFSNGNSTGTGAAPYSSTAYIASVNGVPTANGGGAANSGPTQVYQVSPSNGTLTFVVNSYSLDCAIPVVYTAPSSAGTTPPLLVGANGQPQSGYQVGVGGLTAWSAPAAPSSATGYIVNVVLAPPLSGTNMFDGVVMTGPSVGKIYSFDYSTPSDTFFYTDGTPITTANFTSYVSAASTSQTVPNSTTAAPYPGDQVDVGLATGYAAGTPTAFQFDATNVEAGFAGSPYGDVPAAATTPAASYNGCAFTTGGVCQPGVVVTWTPPANPDVSGSQALAPHGGTAAKYNLWRATVSGTTTGTPTLLGSVTVESGATPTNRIGGTTLIGSPQVIDTTFASGQSYVYYVTATAATGVDGGGQTGPFSAGSTSVAAGSSAVTPTFTYASITPSSCTAVVGPPSNDCSTTPKSTNTAPPTVTNGYALVEYNEAVTCLSGAGSAFAYSNSAAGASATGQSCAQGPSPNTLKITFPPYSSSVIGGTTVYTYTPIMVPANGDTLTYTAPGTTTTANSVYAGTTSSPQYAKTQTITDNGQAGGGSVASPANPLDAGPSIASVASSAGAKTITITYNEAVTCATVDANGSDYTISFAAGTAAAPQSSPTTQPVTACSNVTGVGVVTITYTATTTAPVAGNTVSVVAKAGADGDTVKDTQPTVNQEVTGDNGTASIGA